MSIVLLFSTAVAGAGCGLLLLARRREQGRSPVDSPTHDLRDELAEALQVIDSEVEAHGLLQRYLERAIPGASVGVQVDDPAPGACVALRLGRAYVRGSGEEPLLECSLCGSREAPSACIPAVVAGQAFGSILIERPGGLDGAEQATAVEAVSCAAPVLAHLQSLAAAETRAATDPLTGLPNSRALRETLKRMVAHAGRTISSVSVILLDLDHLKRINDTFGHERGDDSLAAVGQVLASAVRASDYAGRYGGEEFLVLLPDTDRDGAVHLAEKLRESVARITIPGVDRPLSASFGVASLPADGGDGDALVRLADRALHAAKARGRNRVEAAGLSLASGPDA